MPEADIYLNRVDFCRYWPESAGISCDDLLSQIKAGKNPLIEYPSLNRKVVRAFKLALEAGKYLPPVPQLTVPQPTESGLFPINEPDGNSLVIATANNRITFEVLVSIWSQGITPAYFLLVDCLGSTVDMAMVFGDFTPVRLAQMIEKTGLEEKVGHRRMIVPGFTSPLAQDFARETGWEIEVGPVCAVELPLFLGDRWIFPER